MNRRSWGACGLVAAALACGASPAYGDANDLNAYRVEATPKNLKALAAAGFDMTEGRDPKTGKVEIVGTASQIAKTKLRAERVTDNRRGRVSTRAATDTADDSPYAVWTKYDAVADDEKEQYTEQYDRLVTDNPGLVARRSTGTTYEGREIVALQVTKGATGGDIPGRPAVLYNAMQHAREWLAGETCRRTLNYFVDNYGKATSAGREVTALVDTRELWFVCVNNPDGYEFTFTEGNRLWRKNLADNNKDGVIEPGDGVDPNRNFRSNWGLDNEGSSPDPASETYRGPAPASEPETTAMEALFAEINPVFQKNDHTAAELLLYPQGFQQDTPTADHEIFTALAGDPYKPGIEGFLPELSAGLYITNGDFTDWAYSSEKTLSYTPEGTTSDDPNLTGFEYEDSEKLIAQEFRRHLPFALDLAHSADDPAEPESHLGNKAEDFVVDQFGQSYGDPQQVQATVKRKLGDVTMKFRINGGQVLTVPTTEFAGGERYFKNDAVYYQRVRGFVSGTNPGDKVEVWFTAGGKESGRFTYDAVSESDAPVLLLSDEDWSGVQPNPEPLSGPQYLEQYKALLTAAGVEFDVYDVSRDRTPPHNLGILSHYSHVVWYTGDDYVPREPDAPGGSGVAKVAIDTQNRVRDYLNEGGKLFFTGQGAGQVFGENIYSYNPFQYEEREYCNTSEQCIDVQDDFLQFWLGANTYIGGAGTDEEGNNFPVRGFGGAFDSGPFGLEPSHTASLLVTSSIYDPEDFPQWSDSGKAMEFVRPGGSPFDPFTGDWFLAAGTHDEAYKRLTRTIDLTGKTSGKLSFRTSFDLEGDYDYMFVEVRTAGQDDWTTLADANGLTSEDTGLACPSTGDGSNWQSLHPFLAHYQTKTNNGDSCEPTGTTGEWNAATGNSGGWKLWESNIPAEYLDDEIQISITVANDAAVQGLGEWIDDVRFETNDGEVFSTSFEEEGLGGFATPGPPPGTVNQETGWTRAQSAPFVEGSATFTDDTVYTAFGLEKVDGQPGQVAILQDALQHLGAPAKPRPSAPAPTPEPPTDGGGDGGGGGGGNPPPSGNPPGTDPPGNNPPGTGRQAGLSRWVIGSQRLGTVRKRGLKVSVSCPEGACPLELTLRIDRPTQQRLKLKSRRVGRRNVTLKQGPSSVRVKFNKATRRALRKQKQLRVIVVGAVPGAVQGGRFVNSVRLKK